MVQKADLLIKNGEVLEENGRLYPRDILIRNGAIIAKERHNIIPDSNASVLDVSDQIIIPGLVNSHLHSNERYIRGMMRGMPLELWALYVYPGILFHRFSLEEAYCQAFLCGVEMLTHGITSVVDNTFYPGSAMETHLAAAKAYRDLGLRADVSVGCADIPFTETFPAEIWKDNAYAYRTIIEAKMPSPAKVMNLLKDLKNNWNYGQTVRFSVGPSRPQRCSEALWEQLSAFRKEHGIPLHFHCMETQYQREVLPARYNGSMIEFLSENGDLDENVNLIHCVHLTEREMEIIARSGSHVILCPVSNLRLGSGVAPMQKLKTKGCAIGFGTDGMGCNDGISIVETMKLSGLLHMESDPMTIMKDCIGGGRAIMGMKGSWLDVGAEADLVTIDKKQPAMIPGNDIAGKIIYAADLSPVNVLVDGKLVVRDYQVQNVSGRTTGIMEKQEELLNRIIEETKAGRDFADIIFPEAKEYLHERRNMK